jgi:translation initiation factor 1
MKHARRRPDPARVVYSTGAGRMCPGCVRPVAECVCGRVAKMAAAAGPVRVGRETQGRGGKAVTVVAGLALAPAELDDLARALKRHCGTGGTVRDGKIELQGEHRDALVAELTRRGIAAKRAGG